MKYISTRGGVSPVPFQDAVIMGLASDGGLLIPESIPDVAAQLDRWEGLSYQELALEIMSLYVTDIPRDVLSDIVQRSYSTFDDSKVTPIKPVGDLAVLELFHGPTLAFKDIALQFLGNVFEYILEQRNEAVNILGATSGDTGSAAISGIRGKDKINIFIMFPEGKTSPLQERQMTTVLDDNVHNIGIEGSFDDCQSIMKTIFSDLDFKSHYQLAAVNSVNWTRVMAQIVYYFSGYYQLGRPSEFDVCVPTGNFGNIFAGYVARKMGLPIRRLILATNSNDILARFFNSGVYERGEVNFTYSPAMDIQVASNFERYLYYLCDESAEKVSELMSDFQNTGKMSLPFNTLKLDQCIVADAVDNEATKATIEKYHSSFGYIADPHTAVGLTVAEKFLDGDVPLLSLSTAHPAKFSDVMAEALPEVEVSHPTLDALKDLPTRKVIKPAEVESIKALIEASVSPNQN